MPSQQVWRTRNFWECETRCNAQAGLRLARGEQGVGHSTVSVRYVKEHLVKGYKIIAAMDDK